MPSEGPWLLGGTCQPRSLGAPIIDALQLGHTRQPPVGVASQTQIAAVFHSLIPGHVPAVVLPRPHESRCRVSPVITWLRLLRLASVCCRRLSTGENDDDREKNQDNICLPLHDAHPFGYMLLLLKVRMSNPLKCVDCSEKQPHLDLLDPVGVLDELVVALDESLCRSSGYEWIEI